MEKGLLMLTLSMLCLWVLLDEFFGGKKISAVAKKMTPTMPGVGDVLEDAWKDDEQAQESKKKTEKAIEESDINEDAKKSLQDAKDKFFGPGPS